jgi:hypothetical protein
MGAVRDSLGVKPGNEQGRKMTKGDQFAQKMNPKATRKGVF